MSLERWIIGFASTVVALSVALVIAVLLWAWSALPADMSPPDPSSVPETVRTLLWIEFGGDASDSRALGLKFPRPAGSVSGYAISLRVDRAGTHQLQSVLASVLGSLWISFRWTAEEALAEIALHGYFGHRFRGIEAASVSYFGKPVEALTMPQAAALVALTRAPSRYSPWCHPDQLLPRVASLLAAFPEERAAAALVGLLPPPEDACSSL
jgi:Transglycosylase